MAVFKPKIKETTEDRLQKAINLGREEALKQVLEWLEEHTCDSQHFLDDEPDELLWVPYQSQEEMLQEFKERFKIE